MAKERNDPDPALHDEAYFDASEERPTGPFDAKLLRLPLSVLPRQRPIVCPRNRTSRGRDDR